MNLTAERVKVEYVSMPNVDTRPRCRRCSKLLAESVARPWVIKCARCGLVNKSVLTK